VVSARHAEGGQSGHRTRENGIDQDRKNSSINPMLFTFTNNTNVSKALGFEAHEGRGRRVFDWEEAAKGRRTKRKEGANAQVVAVDYTGAGLTVLLALLKMEWCSVSVRRRLVSAAR
jgi:hypothetical protein